jgi:signal transduction histidine kinase/ActR/RegA family two-component response regulator
MIPSLFKRKGPGRKKVAKQAANTVQPGSETTSTSTHDAKIVDDLQLRIETLREQLAASQIQNATKEKRIETLEKQMEKKNTMLGKNEGLEDKLATYLLSHIQEQQPQVEEKQKRSFSAVALKSNPTRKANDVNLDASERVVGDVVDLIDRWLLVEGGKLPDVETLLSHYADYCLRFGIPLDRLVIFGAMIHPKLSSYIWKWEFGKQFREKELPAEVDFKPDEPFTKLMEGEVMEYRMTAADMESPRGCAWFKNENFEDYYALPIHNRGEFKGGIAWSTKSAQGFLDEHIKVFKKSSITLSTVVRCYTNDLAISRLLKRLEDEIKEETSELAQANKCLADANKKIVLQAESQLRNFAMMSHEIRTPLNCIVGLSNLLLDSELDPLTRESIEMITGSGDLLLAVVDDVLDYSKLATGKVETKLELVRLPRIVRAVVASVDTRATPGGVELRTSLADGIPSEVETDGRRLQQILYNLLGNAIKFGQEGRIVEFTVDVISREQDIADSDQRGKMESSEDDLIRFIVKDYGKGILPSEIHKIFQPFQQAATNEPKHGGTGLGLAITRQLVRVLGGTISVESEYGSWCQFVVLLPMNPERPIVSMSQEDDGQADMESVMDCNSSVEDDDGFSSSEDDSTISSSSISRPSQHTTSASRSRRPSFALSTMSTPRPAEEGDCQVLPPYAPIINLEEAQKLLSLARDSPRRVEESCEKQAPSSQVHSATSVTPESPRNILEVKKKQIEFDKLKVLVAEDNKINQKVLHRTLTRLGINDVTIVENGKEAVDISEEVNFDCIFMDMQMPIMDGLEATSIISSRRRQRNESFPKIAFLTAHALQDYQDKAAESGADGFMSKPFKIDIIKELLTKFIEE